MSVYVIKCHYLRFKVLFVAKKKDSEKRDSIHATLHPLNVAWVKKKVSDGFFASKSAVIDSLITKERVKEKR